MEPPNWAEYTPELFVAITQILNILLKLITSFFYLRIYSLWLSHSFLLHQLP